MIKRRTLGICAFGIALMTPKVEAQALSQYRNFELGSDLASGSSLAGIACLRQN
jgi:hypothetical protein